MIYYYLHKVYTYVCIGLCMHGIPLEVSTRNWLTAALFREEKNMVTGRQERRESLCIKYPFLTFKHGLYSSIHFFNMGKKTLNYKRHNDYYQEFF